MDLSSLIPYIANGGVAIAVLVLILTGVLVPGWLYKDKAKENDELKQAIMLERERGNAAVAAANTTRDILLSLRGQIAGRGDRYDDLAPKE